MSNKFEQYIHFDNPVWVASADKGKYRDHCLCFSCANFAPRDRAKNCTIANILYNLCIELDLVTPVWECPRFVEREDK